MKFLLLSLFSLGLLPVYSSTFVEDIRLNASYTTACTAFDKGYLTEDQKNELIIEAYISWNDEYKGNKKARIAQTQQMFRWAGDRRECLQDLENYIHENIYPELKGTI